MRKPNTCNPPFHFFPDGAKTCVCQTVAENDPRFVPVGSLLGMALDMGEDDDKDREPDPYHCPRCGAAYNNADPTSHACPDAETAEEFRADE